MATFHIRRGGEIKARVSIEDDAQKLWEFASEWDRDSARVTTGSVG
jgi:hypothetical protein